MTTMTTITTKASGNLIPGTMFVLDPALGKTGRGSLFELRLLDECEKKLNEKRIPYVRIGKAFYFVDSDNTKDSVLSQMRQTLSDCGFTEVRQAFQNISVDDETINLSGPDYRNLRMLLIMASRVQIFQSGIWNGLKNKNLSNLQAIEVLDMFFKYILDHNIPYSQWCAINSTYACGCGLGPNICGETTSLLPTIENRLVHGLPLRELDEHLKKLKNNGYIEVFIIQTDIDRYTDGSKRNIGQPHELQPLESLISNTSEYVRRLAELRHRQQGRLAKYIAEILQAEPDVYTYTMHGDGVIAVATNPGIVRIYLDQVRRIGPWESSVAIIKFDPTEYSWKLISEALDKKLENIKAEKSLNCKPVIDWQAYLGGPMKYHLFLRV